MLTTRRVAALALVLAVAPASSSSAPPAPPVQAEARDMRLVGHEALQGRSAYQPVITRQGSRVIAYVGHHAGDALNALTGRTEPNGTSIVDVTEPARPRYLHHIPGSGGAQMARVCHGGDLPRAGKARTYLLRTLGDRAHEIWDVTDPARPSSLTTIMDGLNGTHKNWWECDTGIAYLVSDGRPAGWRTNRMTKIFDLGDPARPRFVRDFGLAGQEPGATGPAPPGLHGPISFRGRVYFAYGTGADGVLQIVDRERLLNGDPSVPDRFRPTAASLRYPEVGRLDMPPEWGGHTAFPVLGIDVPGFAPDQRRRRDIVVLVSEALRDRCAEPRHLAFLVDVTTPSRPFPISSVPGPDGDFCQRGGRFGPHASNESFAPAFYGRAVFVSWFNAGVRAIDIRDPFRPREVASFVPAPTALTRRVCWSADGGERCRPVVQTNNVEVDDRGYVYLSDRAGTGLHIVELTGTARALIDPSALRP
jgi:hypothetical protein